MRTERRGRGHVQHQQIEEKDRRIEEKDREIRKMKLDVLQLKDRLRVEEGMLGDEVQRAMESLFRNMSESENREEREGAHSTSTDHKSEWSD